MSLEEALEEIDEKYDLSGSEQAKEIGYSVAHLRD
jgi:hypothetical protein